MNLMQTLLAGTIIITVLLSSCATNQRAFQKEIDTHREAYKKDFLETSRSPFYEKEAELEYLRFFPATKTYRVTAQFKQTPDAQPFDMATYSGITKPFVKYGTLHFTIKGQPIELAVYRSLRLAKIPAYQNHLFIPFKDITNGESTYGGGRYIDILTTDIKNDKLLLDFNKCYNPWCAFSDGYNCPIPPSENHLDVAILAGEKNFGKAVKH